MAPSISETITTSYNGFTSNRASKAMTQAVTISHDLARCTLLQRFLDSYHQLQAFRNGQAVKTDGRGLSIAAIVAAARYGAIVELADSPAIREGVAKSQVAIQSKVDNGISIYGVSTGFGGSADTRTNQPLLLGHALLQHHHVGILPSPTTPSGPLTLTDPMGTSMPEAWVRGAMIVRMNSLIRGHSGVRWEVIEKINELLSANITPFVPLRASISASGDLTPLSYIAGTLVANPSIRVFHGPRKFGVRKISTSKQVLQEHNISPLSFASKEPLGILNGTAFSASVAALALHDAVHLALLAQVCTAMITEALVGTQANYDAFIHDIARPHPGQEKAAHNIYELLEGSKLARLHEQEVGIQDDQYHLRQDRYPLRTAPQFLGPQIEDILSALSAVTQECNSTTDNPLIDGETGRVHHGGNFQAMAITNAMEKTRLALHHIGKLLFAQSTELLNPTMNNGLPPSLAATDPSLDFHAKGVDIATAAYVAELGYLANPVSTHIQSAEMHNQAINSMALVSARATITSLEVLSMLTASVLYVICQALDLRALQMEFLSSLKGIVESRVAADFGNMLSSSQQLKLSRTILREMESTLDKTTTMDNADRMSVVAKSAMPALIEFFAAPEFSELSVPAVMLISQFCSGVALHAEGLFDCLREEHLSGKRGAAPAAPWLHKTRPVYEFIRLTLGVRMHGSENYGGFANGLGVEDVSIGENISFIHEAIRDGNLHAVIVSLFT